MTMNHLVQAAPLRAQITSIVQAAGSSPEEAHKVAANLVMANLSGHDSHGVGMAPRYIDAVLEGGLQPNTGIKDLLDTGPMLLAAAIDIDAQDSAGSLHDRLAALGGKLVVEALARFDELVPVVQPEAGVTYAGKIDKAEARLDWNQPAIDFYEGLGADLNRDWIPCRLAGDSLAQFTFRTPRLL